MIKKIRLMSPRTLLLSAMVPVMLFLCPLAVAAQEFEAADNQTAFIDRFDQDADGLVSLEEFPGPDPIFDQLDADGDGYLSSAEVPVEPPRHGRRPPRDLQAELDADGDGIISVSEFDAGENLFDELDLDGDGYLSRSELSTGAPGPPHGPGFENDDIDGDGRVSESEFSGPSEHFYDLDADGDGYISEAEARIPLIR